MKINEKVAKESKEKSVIELLFLNLSYVAIGFFIAFTGTTLGITINKISEEGSSIPFIYQGLTLIGTFYFVIYKPFKILLKL